MRLARVLGGVGRTMITAGVLILLFVVYQLWGTGILQAQAQDRLSKSLDAQLATTTSTTTTPGTVPPSTAPPLVEAPAEGDPIGRIEIERISLKAVVVEGVRDEDLKDGPGHYPNTPMPGQKGNAAIAGHRTTYGAPFASIDELQVGDKIGVTTLQGHFTYEVMPQADGSAHLIVSPSHVEVLDDAGDNRLTLTACHPKYSASQRIIVNAKLVGEPIAAPVTTPHAEQQAGLGGKRSATLPALLWALLCAVIWLTAWLAGKRWRKWPAYAIGLPFFLVALFFFFESFSTLLPSNY
ncbi:MAG: class E sortase [Acidimicrobiales bacterium]